MNKLEFYRSVIQLFLTGYTAIFIANIAINFYTVFLRKIRQF